MRLAGAAGAGSADFDPAIAYAACVMAVDKLPVPPSWCQTRLERDSGLSILRIEWGRHDAST